MIQNAASLWPRTGFARNIAMMASAGVGGHAIFLACIPVLTRLYAPEHFALMVLFSTAQALTLTWATGRVEISIPNTADDRAQRVMIAMAFTALCLSCLVLIAVAWLTPSDLFGFAADAPVPRTVLMILPVSVCMAGTQAILQSWYVAQKNLRLVSLARVALSASYCALAICAGLIDATGVGLTLCFATSHLVAAAVLVSGAPRLRGGRPDWPFARSVLRTYRQDFLASVSASVVHGIAFYMMFLLIWWYYDAIIVGWFALVFRIAMAPIGLLTTALAKGFWAEAADLARRDTAALRRLYLRLTGMLALGALAFSALSLAAPLYFGAVFGRDWAGAGALLAALTPMLAAMIMFSSTNHFIVYRRQHWQLGCDLVTIGLLLLAFHLMTTIGAEPAATIAVASMAFLISYLLRFALHLRANRIFKGGNEADV